MSWRRIGTGSACDRCGAYKHVESDGNGRVRELCRAACELPEPAPAPPPLTGEELRHHRRNERRRKLARLKAPDRHCPCGCGALMPRTRGRPPKFAPTCLNRHR